MDKVTILMPTYNRAGFFLPRAINSVLHQTHYNFQLVIGDNASTDNTEDVVKAFKDKRITYTRSFKNTGTQNTFFNIGLKDYGTKYTAFIEDDDMYYPSHIERLFEKIQQGYGAVYCFAMNVFYDEFNIPISAGKRGSEWDKNLFMFGGAYFNWIDQSDIMVDRKALLSVGGFREDANFQDYAIMAKLCMRYSVGCVPEILTECGLSLNKYGENVNDGSAWRNSDTLKQHVDIF
jgi:glycosyltransferase involved in cell wall biosynthesis